ncbi:MAG: DNA-binding protein [Clostridiaceae bacterium]|nr:DNA-binding protein [Clostridiaceae bacterium]
MEFKKFDDTYVVRLDRGEELVSSIKNLCEKEDITLGTISGLGAANHIIVGLYKVEEKKYYSKEFNGDFELTSIVGNISKKENDTYLHIHLNFGDENGIAHGGHLNEAVISATCELFIRKIAGSVNRKYDENVGLNLYEF